MIIVMEAGPPLFELQRSFSCCYCDDLYQSTMCRKINQTAPISTHLGEYII